MLLVCPVIAVPPVATVYHLYCPLVPPDADSVITEFEQPEAPVVVGALGMLLTIAATATRLLSQVAGSKIEAKKVVVEFNEGLTKDDPVKSSVVVTASAYQR